MSGFFYCFYILFLLSVFGLIHRVILHANFEFFTFIFLFDLSFFTENLSLIFIHDFRYYCSFSRFNR